MTQEEEILPIQTPTPEEPPISAEQALEEELKECKDKYLRLLAETENTRKRLQKEKVESTRFAIENALAEFLSPIDNLENALQCTQSMSEETARWAQGFQMILGQLKEALSYSGITPFSSLGATFDPYSHEAVETEETTEQAEGIILQEYLRGYKSAHRIIRPARVKVSKAPTPSQTNT